ncbi:hypothetical protein ZWY2020_057113 [Hordeum vulgare]|nr:hypothetical protein ZWY2020_057113 [Hordeum vulgare]
MGEISSLALTLMAAAGRTGKVFYTIWKQKLSMLAAWAERFRALDGVNEVMPDPQRLLQYNLMRRSRLGLPLTPPPQHQ